MLTILSFLLTLIGGVNWLMIGLLQYDFIAGIFGYQASIFSRIIYIIIGASGIVLLFKMFKGKGTIAVFSRKNKKDLEKNIEKINEGQLSPQRANVEASKEHIPQRNQGENVSRSRHYQDYPYSGENYDDVFSKYPPFDDYSNQPPHQDNDDGFFDEHLNQR